MNVALVVVAVVALIVWLVCVNARVDAERYMSTNHDHKLEALLALRGHMLTKRQRTACEVWLARRVVERNP